MGLRPARCYRDIERPYTRYATRVIEKNYIGGVPGLRIRRFITGNTRGKFNTVFYLVSEQDIQVRENALEAARMAINRYLERNLTREKYFFKLRVYPHHVLRENRQLTGAGADRLQKGMSRAFGKPVGRAAQVRKGTIIFEVWTDASNEAVVKEAFRRGKMKLPGDYKMTSKRVEEA